MDYFGYVSPGAVLAYHGVRYPLASAMAMLCFCHCLLVGVFFHSDTMISRRDKLLNLFLSVVPPFPLAFGLMLRDLCGLTRFIETGTYHGDTARLVAPHFERVLTMEAVAERFWAIAGPDWPDNVIRVCDDSATDLLGYIRGAEPTMFWLDAHWISNGTGPDDDPLMAGISRCPLRDELTQIACRGDYAADVILIDDARYFLRPPIGRGRGVDWPSLEEIVELLPDRFIFVHSGVLVAAPNKYRPQLNEWLLEHPDPGDERAPK